jgi:sterol desaturase/sphingolipid hydroxylase (fatty acid hydroxylase superfamily)
MAHGTNLGLLLVAAAGSAGALVWVTVAGIALRAAPCPHDPPLRIGQVKEPLLIVAGCLAFFLLGHGLARLQGFDFPAARSRRSRRRARVIFVQSVLTAFLLLVAGLLAFETYALAVGIWPITYYVRCSDEIAAWAAVPAAAVASFLLGRWLWYPYRHRET